MAKRVQLSRKKGYRKPADAVNVARPTKWGNPFNWKDLAVQPGYETPKELAVREYSHWLEGLSPYRDFCPEKRQWILDHLHELAGKDLACWCKSGEYCHADILLRLANKALATELLPLHATDHSKPEK